MALRLTSSTLAPNERHTPSPTAPADPDGPRAHALAARGAAALAASDLLTYGRLFEETAELQDPSRRYHARKLLLEQGFTVCARTGGDGAATGILVAMAKGALTALEADPAEPVLLGYAGVVLYELWSLEAARSLFTAAGRLDPELPHLRRNLAECNRRRRAAGTRAKRPLHPELPGLARRATRVASAARPADGLTLSLCMIVRDEEEMLPRCLEAVAPAVDEIVIVDTGSRDRTVEIAHSFGARVIEQEWTGSFADARNVSFDAATGDWVLYLDADEVLVAEDVDKLRALRAQTWREAFYFVETNFTGAEGDGTAVTHSALRMFRNRPQYRFEGRLHEQIAQHLPAYLPERLTHTGVRIEHYGYLGVVRDAKEKSRRNIELLLAQQAENPGQPSPFLHFNLGSEYFAAGDGAKALAEYERAWELIEAAEREEATARHEFLPILVVRLVKALRVCGRPLEAIERAAAGLERFPGFTDLVYEQGAASLTLRRDADAAAYFEQCIDLGDAPAKYTALVGCGTYLPRIALAEIDLRHGHAASALQRLEWCVEHHPDFFGVVHPYATALLRGGHAPEQVAAEVERRIPRLSPTVRFMLGTALFEAGAAEPAAEQFRAVLERQPGSGAARVALAEALLYLRHNEDAAREAAAISPDDALAAVALRSELFGRLCASDLDGAREALARAGAANVTLPAPERNVFDAWLSVRAGGEPAPVPAAAGPLLEVMLEALLRVQDFESFESLHAVLGASELTLRERRELLGGAYLRRGFLKSAAREWLAVCQERADVPALVGLAQVSLASEMPEQAGAFAAEALTLDPDCAAARAIADRVALPAAA